MTSFTFRFGFFLITLLLSRAPDSQSLLRWVLSWSKYVSARIRLLECFLFRILRILFLCSVLGATIGFGLMAEEDFTCRFWSKSARKNGPLGDCLLDYFAIFFLVFAAPVLRLMKLRLGVPPELPDSNLSLISSISRSADLASALELFWRSFISNLGLILYNLRIYSWF